MKDYRKFLLSKLVDDYENSASYNNEAQNRNIYFKFNTKTIKDYFDELNYKYKEEIDIVCNHLEQEQLIKVFRGKGYNSHNIEKIMLIIPNVSKAYTELQRKEKREKEEEIFSLISKYKDKEGALGNFTRFIIDRLESNKSVKKYLDMENINECKDILHGIESVLAQNTEIFRRNFSIKIYGDSKKYETLENKICRIIKDFSNDENIENEYNIIPNYTYVYFKGNIMLKFKDTNINAKEFKGGIAISSEDIENIKEITVYNKLITIENLTTFNNYNDNCGIVYLGGYHNKVRQNLLRKIYDNNKSIAYYHFGDIDAGGFKILVHLRNKTKIKFKPMNMDCETLLRYKDYGKKLSTNDIKEINRLLGIEEYSEFYPVLKSMLDNNIKLEQEIIM